MHLWYWYSTNAAVYGTFGTVSVSSLYRGALQVPLATVDWTLRSVTAEADVFNGSCSNAVNWDKMDVAYVFLVLNHAHSRPLRAQSCRLRIGSQSRVSHAQGGPNNEDTMFDCLCIFIMPKPICMIFGTGLLQRRFVLKNSASLHKVAHPYSDKVNNSFFFAYKIKRCYCIRLRISLKQLHQFA